MIEYKIDRKFLDRYLKFLDSKEYMFFAQDQKTEYWDHQSANINIDIDGNRVRVSGQSGFNMTSSRKNIYN